MKKHLVILFTIIVTVCLFTSCKKKVTLTYDEASQGAILERDLSVSPKDNLAAYLSTADTKYKKIEILNEGGASCACTLLRSSCTCKLRNAVGANPSCDDMNSKCTRLKVIKIDVVEGAEGAFAGLGFK